MSRWTLQQSRKVPFLVGNPPGEVTFFATTHELQQGVRQRDRKYKQCNVIKYGTAVAGTRRRGLTGSAPGSPERSQHSSINMIGVIQSTSFDINFLRLKHRGSSRQKKSENKREDFCLK